MAVCNHAHVCVCPYIGVDFRVAHSKGTILVQQDAAVARALIQFLLSYFTPRDGGVGFFIAPVQTVS